MAQPPGVARVAQSIWRSVGFFALIFAAGLPAYGLLLPMLVWLVARTGQHMRVDVFAELAAALLATAVMLRAVDRRAWSDLGLARSAARAHPFAVGLIVGLAAIVLTCVAPLALGLLQIVRTDEASGASLWLASSARVSIVLLTAALAEEVICRGYLLTAIRDSVGTRGAIAATSVIFGLFHMTNPGATGESVALVTLAGIFLATVRVALDSLYAAWMAHFAWNWVMAVPMHAAVSGVRFEQPGYTAVTIGPEWLSGGQWGPEGGVFAAVGMLAALGYLYARHRREE